MNYQTRTTLLKNVLKLKPISENYPEKILNSELEEVLAFTKNYAGIRLNEKRTCMTNIDEAHTKSDCVEGSIVKGRREGFPFALSLTVPAGFEVLN